VRSIRKLKTLSSILGFQEFDHIIAYDCGSKRPIEPIDAPAIGALRQLDWFVRKLDHRSKRAWPRPDPHAKSFRFNQALVCIEEIGPI